MMSKNALIIFQKNRVLGKVKTRLAKSIGDEKALFIYEKLIERTQKVTTALKFKKFVYFSDELEDSSWKNVEFKIQVEGDLGLKMFRAIEEVKKKGYENIVLIGTDCFDLQTEHLEEAFIALENHHYVLGPAKDGGYYLIGTNQLNSSVFLNKKWSHDQVLKEALSEIEGLKSSFFLLEMLNDIDELEDLEGSGLLIS